MKKYIIDTNALISYVTDRHPDQQKKMAAIFQEVVKLKAVILCPPNVLTEVVYVLDKVYGVPKTDIRRMMKDFLAMPGIQLVHEIDFGGVLRFWPEALPDFGDAIVASWWPNVVNDAPWRPGRRRGCQGRCPFVLLATPSLSGLTSAAKPS